MSPAEEKTGPDYGEHNELAPLSEDEFWAKAEAIFPGASADRYSVRVDQEVYEWFAAGGADYEQRINAILRQYMQANQK